MHPHSPPATRGADGGGVPGNTCGACHLDGNVDILAGEQASFRSIPGHPRWGLAPIEMAWQGKSLSEVCRQIRDPRRNGGRNLELLHEHLAKDDLVAWGWHPGLGRDPAPGTQHILGELIRAWIDTGALYGDRYAEFLDRVYFPYVVAKDVTDFRNGGISVRFEGISGRIDQGARILFNLKPNGDYLTVRANPLEIISCCGNSRKEGDPL